jgi:hypothetical protein
LGPLREHACCGGSATKYLTVHRSGALKLGHSASVQPTLAGDREQVVDCNLQRGPADDVAPACEAGASDGAQRERIDKDLVR